MVHVWKKEAFGGVNQRGRTCTNHLSRLLGKIWEILTIYWYENLSELSESDTDLKLYLRVLVMCS